MAKSAQITIKLSDDLARRIGCGAAAKGFTPTEYARICIERGVTQDAIEWRQAYNMTTKTYCELNELPVEFPKQSDN